MLKKSRNLLKYIISLFIISLGLSLASSSKCQSKIVKTSVEADRLKKLKASIEANPEQISAHEKFINAFNIQDPLLEEQYKIWMTRFPSSAIVPFIIGKTYYNKEDTRARVYLLKTVAIRPNLSEAWYFLSIDAMRWGDYNISREYMRKAAMYDPKNENYASKYAYSYKDVDPVKYDSLSLDVVRRFPNSEVAAGSLILLAKNSKNPGVKIAYYELLYKLFLNHHAENAGSLRFYYDFLINTNPQKAYEIALIISAEVKRDVLEWRHKTMIAKKFVDARYLLDSKRPEEALSVLKTIDLNNTWSVSFIAADETLILFKAEAADAANQTQTAYDSIASYYSKEPSDRLYATLLSYGARLHMDSNKVDKDILEIREKGAHMAMPFTLKNYLTSKEVSLSDYKGKVVLLTYWFPGCGPCRAEFPHFESVLKKFNSKEVIYLGINGVKEQDDYVIPFMKSTRYSFIPLKENINRNNGNLRAISYPTNYLIDQQGRIVFSNFMIDGTNERMLEIMIGELLENNTK